MRVIKQHSRTQLIEINLNFSKLITIDVTNLMMGLGNRAPNESQTQHRRKTSSSRLRYILISSNNSQSLKAVNLYQLKRFRIQFMASEWLEYQMMMKRPRSWALKEIESRKKNIVLNNFNRGWFSFHYFARYSITLTTFRCLTQI